jgi:SAM-dependent methyltransferase
MVSCAVVSTADFYDRLSPFYHLIYPNWERSIERQASALDAIIKQNWPRGVTKILDATCGIGTQAIGLAKLGYRVSGSDLSTQSVERARREAAQRGLDIRFSCCDVRELSQHHPAREFDLVISCDNSLPHLLTDDDLLVALRQMNACTRPGGGCLVSVRDYAKQNLEGVQVKPYGVRDDAADGKRYLAFQTWDCRGRTYDVTLYLIEDTGGADCRTYTMRSTYYAVSIDRLLELMGEAGFENAQRIDRVYFQPILAATRSGGGVESDVAPRLG